MGVSRSKIARAKRQVELDERYPFLQSWPQDPVLEFGKLLDLLPEDQHAGVVRTVEAMAAERGGRLTSPAIRILRHQVLSDAMKVAAVSGSPQGRNHAGGPG